METKAFVVYEENNWEWKVLQPALAVPIRRSEIHFKGILKADKALGVTLQCYSQKESTMTGVFSFLWQKAGRLERQKYTASHTQITHTHKLKAQCVLFMILQMPLGPLAAGDSEFKHMVSFGKSG